MSFNNFDKESLARIASEAIEGFEQEVEILLSGLMKVKNHYTCECIFSAAVSLGNNTSYSETARSKYVVHSNASRVSWLPGFLDILQKGKLSHLQEIDSEILRDIRLERMYLFNREHFCMDGAP